MVTQTKFEKDFVISADQSDFFMFTIDSKDELILFGIHVEPNPSRVEDIQIYIIDEQNYQKYVEYYRARRSGNGVSHIRWVTYAQAKASWTPMFFHSNVIGTYYLILDNLHSTITKKNIHISGSSSSYPLQKLTKSKTTATNHNSLSNIILKFSKFLKNYFVMAITHRLFLKHQNY